MIEYPKALYMDGDAEKELLIVEGADAEAAAREEGYAMIGEAVEAVEKPKRGRPKSV